MSIRNKIFITGLLPIAIVLFSACGGEADYSLEDVNPTFEGKFIDDAVEGLEYRRSSGETGVTSTGGNYNYKRGEIISFHVGSLELGGFEGSSIITPRELAANTDIIEDSSISNRVRLMLALDSDDQRIGIQIDQAMRSSANTWNKSIDFSKSESEFLTEVAVVTNGDIPSLVSASIANDHFAKSLRCAYSGAYQGAWEIPDSNESTGYVGAMIQADGDVILMGDGQSIPPVTMSDGRVLSAQENSVVYVTGIHEINTKKYTFTNSTFWYYNHEIGQLLGVTGGDTITGEGINLDYRQIRGTFTQGAKSGSYNLTRADASQKAAYRYTGLCVDSSGVIGLLIMDIDADGTIKGLIHDARDTTLQPELIGHADFETGEVRITVNMPDFISLLSGTINFNNTSEDTNLTWTSEDESVSYGRAEIDGCQLQAID